MSYPRADDKQLAMVATLPIEFLSIRSSEVTNVGLESIAENASIATLFLNTPKINDDGLPVLAKLPALKSLSIENAAVTDAGIRFLIGRLSTDGRLGALALKSCPNLTVQAVRGIDRLESLTSLGLEGNPGIDGSVMQILGPTISLHSLQLSRTAVSSQHLTGIERVDLNHLDLSYTQIEDSVITDFVRLIPDLSVLSLNRSDVQDEDLRSIGTLTNLRYINLHDTQITADGLAYLPKTQHQLIVTLSKSAISSEDMERLRKDNPMLNLQTY